MSLAASSVKSGGNISSVLIRKNRSRHQKLQSIAAGIRIQNNVSRADVEHLLPKASATMGMLADPDTVLRIAKTNPDSIWLVYRDGDDKPGGFQATLLLNDAGRAALIA